MVTVGTLSFSWSWKKCFQFFTIENNVCWGVVIYGLYYDEKGSFYSDFLKSFHHKWVLNFIKIFLCLYWDDYMVFIFKFVNMLYHRGWFAYIAISLHPWDKPHLIMVYDPCNVLVLFAIIILRIFTSMFISDIGLSFSFLCVASFSSFYDSMMMALLNEVGSFLPSAIFRRVWGRWVLAVL